MFLVGLTGGIATGKSTISKYLQELGVPVVDADRVAREVVAVGRPAWRKIRHEFGTDVLDADSGEINRERLGQIVFNDADKRRRLNQITHPYIYRQMFCECVGLLLRGHRFAVLDLPLLFESGYMLPFLHRVIVVTCSPQQQLGRLMARNNLNHEQATARIESQMSLEEKARRADFVVDNSGDLESTRSQVDEVVARLRRSWAPCLYRTVLLGGIALIVGTASLAIRYLLG